MLSAEFRGAYAQYHRAQREAALAAARARGGGWSRRSLTVPADARAPGETSLLDSLERRERPPPKNQERSPTSASSRRT